MADVAPYVFTPVSGGNIQVAQTQPGTGTPTIIGTGSADYAKGFGYDPSSQAATEPSSISSDKTSQIADLQKQVADYSQTSGGKNSLPTGFSYGKPASGAYSEMATPSGTAYKSSADLNLQQQREQGGTYTGIDGGTLYRFDNSPVSAGTTGSASTNTDANGVPTGDPMQYAIDSAKKAYDSVMQATDPMTQSLVASIQSKYASLIDMQRMTNAGQQAGIDTALERAGTSRYSPISAAGVSATQMSAGALALADLQQKENEAVLNVQNAAQKNAWDQVSTLLGEVDKIRTDKISLAKTQNENLAQTLRQQSIGNVIKEQMGNGVTDPGALFSAVTTAGITASPQDIADSIKALNPISDSMRQSILGDAIKSHAPTDVLQSITSAKSIGDAVLAAGKYLSQSDYETYAQNIVKSGGVPVDPNTFYANPTLYKKVDVSGSLQYDQSVVDEGYKILQTGKANDGTAFGNAQGSDGFVDPAVYLKLMDQWRTNKGNVEDFVKEFPLSLINPANTEIGAELAQRGVDWKPKAGAPSSTTASAYFSKTQIAEGAKASGKSIQEFGNMSVDDANKFIGTSVPSGADLFGTSTPSQ